jgi:hypothetical protein
MYTWDESANGNNRLLRDEDNQAVGVIDWNNSKSCWLFSMYTNSINANIAQFEVGHDPDNYPDTEYILNLFLLRYEG